MNINTSARYCNNVYTVNKSFAKRLAQWLATLILCAGLCGLVAPRSVRANEYQMAYTVGHAYVYYTTANVPAPTGTLQDAMATPYDDSHVWDLYGNLLVINRDNSVSYSNQAVGFVYTQPAGP